MTTQSAKGADARGGIESNTSDLGAARSTPAPVLHALPRDAKGADARGGIGSNTSDPGAARSTPAPVLHGLPGDAKGAHERGGIESNTSDLGAARSTPAPVLHGLPRDAKGADERLRRSHLKQLEAESIHILREVVAECQRPVLLYSIGKDSSVLLRLAQKAFYPGKIPFPLLHIDTSYKFKEMIEFRDRYTAELGLHLIVHTNHAALDGGATPFAWGTQRCCGGLKTQALLDGLRAGGYDAAIGGARRDEEKSRAKERVFSFRDTRGQWDPRNQRPELWNVFNTRLHPGESLRVFPLSNWTELDVWQYIHAENIPIVPLYLAKERPMLVRGESLLPIEQPFVPRLPGEEPQLVKCRMRSLGCSPCTGAIRSDADSVPRIIEELVSMRKSERQNRIIDYDQEGSMEIKKQEGYF